MQVSIKGICDFSLDKKPKINSEIYNIHLRYPKIPQKVLDMTYYV